MDEESRKNGKYKRNQMEIQRIGKYSIWNENIYWTDLKTA